MTNDPENDRESAEAAVLKRQLKAKVLARHADTHAIAGRHIGDAFYIVASTELNGEGVQERWIERGDDVIFTIAVSDMGFPIHKPK